MSITEDSFILCWIFKCSKNHFEKFIMLCGKQGLASTFSEPDSDA